MNLMRYAGWGAALRSCYALSVVMMGTTIPTPLYVIYQQDMGFGALWLTTIFGVYALGVLSSLILVGSWSDNIGRKPMMHLGLLTATAGTILFVFAGTAVELLVARFVSGLAAGILIATASIFIIELSPKLRTGSLLATASNTLGIGIGPPLAGYLISIPQWGISNIFVLHAFLLTLAFLGLMGLPETVHREHRARLHIRWPSVPDPTKSIFLPAALAGMAGFSASGLFTGMLPSILREVIHVSNSVVAGAIVSIFFISSIGGQALLSWIPTRNHLPVGCIALTIGMASLGASVYAQSVLAILLSGVISGIGQGITLRAGLASVIEASPADKKANVTSALFVVFYLSVSVPIIIVGAGVEVMGIRATALIFSAVNALFPLIALRVLLRKPLSLAKASSANTQA